MKKLLISLLFLSVIVPSTVEAKPRCKTQGNKTQGKVTVCRLPKPPRKCGTKRRPCIPPGYYHPSPPLYVPHR